MEEQNPYQSPSIEVAEELDQRQSPPSEVLARHLAANTNVSSGFIAVGLGGAILIGSVLAMRSHERAVVLTLTPLIAFSLLLAFTGLLQRHNHFVAVVANAALATTLLLVLLFGYPLLIVYGAAHGRFNWGLTAYMGLVLCGLTYVLTVPLRLAIQAWRWRRQGICLTLSEREFRDRRSGGR